METAASSSREPKYGIRDNEVCLAGFVFSCRKRSYVPTAVHREPNRVAEKTVQTVVMLLTTVLVLCLITLSLIWAPWPYFGVFLSLAYLAVRITLEKKEERIWRIFFLNASVLLLLLTLFEGGLELHQWIKKARTPQVKTSSHKLFGEDEQFGKAAQESARVSFSVGGTKVYDVQYTIDEYKLRETPAEGRVGKPAVVLFGCSITFGEGVEDDEAFPYILAEKFKTEKRVLNFAFSGYGTNHMLTWLRSDRMQPAQRGSIPETVLYVFIKDHVRRACGQVRFAARSPSFLLQSDGSLTRDGLFNEPKLSSSFFRRLLRYDCLLYTSPSPRDRQKSRMPSSA